MTEKADEVNEADDTPPVKSQSNKMLWSAGDLVVEGDEQSPAQDVMADETEVAEEGKPEDVETESVETEATETKPIEETAEEAEEPEGGEPEVVWGEDEIDEAEKLVAFLQEHGMSEADAKQSMLEGTGIESTGKYKPDPKKIEENKKKREEESAGKDNG